MKLETANGLPIVTGCCGSSLLRRPVSVSGDPIVCFRPVTEDGLPFIGAVPGVDGGPSGPHYSKREPAPGSPAGSNGPTSSAQAKARAITLRTCHCPPRGALIPRAFRASAICRSDVAPLS